MNNLQFLGIYESAINSAIDTCENVLKEHDLENMINAMNDAAKADLSEIGSWDNITNSIILAYFSATKSQLVEAGTAEDKIDFYVNGDDSHFYIDNEEQ